MNLCNSIITVLFVVSALSLNGQSSTFQDISTFDDSKQVKGLKMIFFHFDGCPPCKRMDREVLSDEGVKTYLQNSFDFYTVYGFDSLETHYRTLFGVTGNPCFLFIDEQNNVKHKIVGFFDPESFIGECKKANSHQSLSSLEKQYSQDSQDSQDLLFVRKYVYAKEYAGDLNNDLIDSYLEMIPNDSLHKIKYLEDVLRLGYYQGQRTIKYNSRLFDYLSNLYKEKSNLPYEEHIRCGIIFSINDALYELDLDEQEKLALIEEMSKHENGRVISLKDIDTDSDNFYALFEDTYPSYMYRYEQALQKNDKTLATNIFKNHLHKINSDPKALNNIAWGIFTEEYKEDLNMGIDIIQQAIKLKDHYNYYDTYASLLHKTGGLKKAKEMAIKAIHLAQESGIEFAEAKDLLVRINNDLGNE